MPKSRRAKQVSLTKTDKGGKGAKESLVTEIQACLDEFKHVHVFSVENMRNAKIKEVRTAWRHSRFFFGKNRVMALALGRSPEEEVRPGLHKIAAALVGNVGVLLTNKPEADVTHWFSTYSDKEYARSGNAAPATIVIPAGPLPQFSHAIEPNLRKLGLPSSLDRGIVTLLKDHTVCTASEPLTPEQARILKLFELATVEFKITLLSSWDGRTGAFTAHVDGPAGVSAEGDDEGADDDDDDDE